METIRSKRKRHFCKVVFLKVLRAPNPRSPPLHTQPFLPCLFLSTEMKQGNEQLHFLLPLHFLAIQLYTCGTVYTALICCAIV